MKNEPRKVFLNVYDKAEIDESYLPIDDDFNTVDAENILWSAEHPCLGVNVEYINISEFHKVIKLNEELTAENSRLLLDVDEKQRSIDYWMDLSKRQTSNNADLSIELQSIKSKWWYKLMTWGWK